MAGRTGQLATATDEPVDQEQQGQGPDDGWVEVIPQGVRSPQGGMGASGEWEEVLPKGLGGQEGHQNLGLMDYAKKVPGFLSGVGAEVFQAARNVGNVATFGLQDRFMTPDDKATWDKLTAARTPEEEAGKTAAGVAGYYVPGLIEGKGAVTGERLLARGGKEILKRAAKVGAKEATRTGAVALAETGSPKEAAEQAALAGGLATGGSAAAQALSPPTKRLAQKVMERFLIPGGGPGYNKEVAHDAAAELIRRGTTAWSKIGFTRKVEQHVMDYGKAITQVEDEALARMGYAPIGEHTWQVGFDPVTEYHGPVHDVTPETLPARRTQEVGRPQQGLSRNPPADQGEYRTRYNIRFSKVEGTRQGQVDINQMLRDMRGNMARMRAGGHVIPGHEGMYKTQVQIYKRLSRMATPRGTIDIADAIKLRRGWDALLDHTIMRPEVVANRDVYKFGANGLRHAIAEQLPGMAEANGQYSFWLGINDILKDKELQTVGHKVLSRTGVALSAAGGLSAFAKTGNLEQAFAAAAVTAFAERTMESAPARTYGAKALDRMGDSMARGDFLGALRRLSIGTVYNLSDREREGQEREQRLQQEEQRNQPHR